ncbi:unnamed protein product [Calypogeia fissa]
MARWSLNGWVLALVAVLAILAGNLTPVIGKRELVNSLQSTSNLAEHHILDGNGSPSGTWTITNLIDAAITVSCRNQKSPLGTVVLNFQKLWFRQFGATTYQQIFECQFSWPDPSGNAPGLLQEFNIWEHDDPESFLLTCTDCNWNIMEDGFYFQQTDGTFVLEYPWK